MLCKCNKTQTYNVYLHTHIIIVIRVGYKNKSERILLNKISDQTHARLHILCFYSDPLQYNGYRLGAHNILQYIIIIIMM